MTSKGNIMVLDSDADVALLLEEVLISEGYSLRRCDGAATVAAIARARPDVLILELSPLFPSATIHLLTKLRQDAAARDVAVLVISTDARIMAIMAEPLGHFGCAALLKPFDIDVLLERVDWLMAAREASRATDLLLIERG